MFLKIMFIASAVTGTLVLAEPAAPEGGVQPVPASLYDSIDRSIEQRMQATRIVGLGAAIIVNRKLVWTKGYGFADKEHALPFTENTIMNIGLSQPG